jgi:hypothetical protein
MGNKKTRTIGKIKRNSKRSKALVAAYLRKKAAQNECNQQPTQQPPGEAHKNDQPTNLKHPMSGEDEENRCTTPSNIREPCATAFSFITPNNKANPVVSCSTANKTIPQFSPATTTFFDTISR